jgi:hypothetical protein
MIVGSPERFEELGMPWILVDAAMRVHRQGRQCSQIHVAARARVGFNPQESVGRDWKGKLSPVLYRVAIIATLLSPLIAQAVYMTAALIWLIPDRRIESVLPRSGHSWFDLWRAFSPRHKIPALASGKEAGAVHHGPIRYRPLSRWGTCNGRHVIAANPKYRDPP